MTEKTDDDGRGGVGNRRTGLMTEERIMTEERDDDRERGC